MSKYTLEEKLKKDEEYLAYQHPKAIILNNQDKSKNTINSQTASTANTFTPSANYTNAMNMTNSLLSQIATKNPSSNLRNILSQIQNREKFSYDINKDPLFQQALNSAKSSGNTAMKDTMGQAAALTGGYGSSYSTAAGSSAYNNFLNQVYDSAPQYHDRAYQQYQDETNALYNQYAAESELANLDYQHMLNLYNAYNNMAESIYNKDYTAYQDALTEKWRQINYEANRDDENFNRYTENRAYADSRDDIMYDREFNEQAYADSRDDAMYARQADYRDYIAGRDDERYYREADYRNYIAGRDDERFDREFSERQFNYSIGDTNNDGVVSPAEQAYLDEVNKASKTTTEKLSNGKDASKMDDYKKNAVNIYNSKGENGLNEYVANLGLSESENDEIFEYVLANGEAPLLYQTFTKTIETKNGGGGVDNNDKVKDKNGKIWKLSELEKALEEEGIPDSTINALLLELTGLELNNSYTYS